MKKAQIAEISLIANNKKGQVINLAVIRTTNGVNIVRNVKQLVTDLDGSYRLIGANTDFMTSVKHPAVQKAVSKLRGGFVEGDWTTFKKGDEYKITKEMSCITDPNHPDFGKAKVGETRVHTADGVIVDGFLGLYPSAAREAIEAAADASATLTAELAGMFDTGSSSAASADDIPEFDESVAAAVGAGKE